jgi:hypothetical protein
MKKNAELPCISRENPANRSKSTGPVILPTWYQQICGGESTLADAIMDRISYDSYKIDIESIDPSKDLSMREVYGLDPALAK